MEKASKFEASEKAKSALESLLNPQEAESLDILESYKSTTIEFICDFYNLKTSELMNEHKKIKSLIQEEYSKEIQEILNIYFEFISSLYRIPKVELTEKIRKSIELLEKYMTSN